MPDLTAKDFESNRDVTQDDIDYHNELRNSGQMSIDHYQWKPVFDHDYIGPRFKYGLKNGAYNVATVPKGEIQKSDRPDDKEHGSLFGTIEYPYALSEEQITNYQLIDFQAIKAIEKPSKDFKQIAQDIISKDVFRETVSKTIQNDGQRILDAIFKEDIEALKAINIKYAQEAGRNQGGGGAGPGKVKQARRGAEPVYNSSLIAIKGFDKATKFLLADESATLTNKELNTMPSLDPAAQKYLDDRQNHNDQAEEHHRLRDVGQKALPGIRFQDAAEVGRVWEAKGKGDLTEQQWNDYTNDLKESGKVSVMTRQDAETKPPFDDEYTGPRYKYGLRNRPFGIATAPKGAILMTYKPEDKEAGSRHGTVEYPFQLTKDEVASFELVDFPAIKQQAIDFRIIRNEFVDELEHRGFILSVSHDAGMLADRVSNGFIQAGIESYGADNRRMYQLTLNTDKLSNPIVIEYQTPADIDIQRSLKWIDKEIAKANAVDPLSALHAFKPDFAAFVMKQDEGHNIGYSPKESVLHIEATAKANGLNTQWTYENNSDYGPMSIVSFTSDSSTDIAGAQIFNDGKAMFFLNDNRFKEGELYASRDPETQTWAIINIAAAIKHTQTVAIGETIGKKLVSSENGFDDFDISDISKINRILEGVWEGSVEKSLSTFIKSNEAYINGSKIFQHAHNLKTSCQLRLIGDPAKYNFAEETHKLAQADFIITNIDKYDLRSFVYKLDVQAAGSGNPLMHDNEARRQSVIDQTLEFSKTVENYNQEQARTQTILPPATDPEATLRELWTRQGVSQERQDALIADVTAKAQPGAQVGPFVIPQELPSINPSTTPNTQEALPMENTDTSTVRTTTELTAKRLSEKLDYEASQHLKNITFLNTRLAYVTAEPESEAHAKSKSEHLFKIATKEAINELSNTEYSRNQITIRALESKKAGTEPLTKVEEVQLSKTIDRNARLSKDYTYKSKSEKIELDIFKEANPNVEKKNLPYGPVTKAFKSAFYFNCTEDGLKKKIEELSIKRTDAISVSDKLKEIPDQKFSMTRIEQRDMPNLKYDEKFIKQIDEALTAKEAAKTAPAPTPEAAPEVKKSRSRK